MKTLHSSLALLLVLGSTTAFADNSIKCVAHVSKPAGVQSQEMAPTMRTLEMDSNRLDELSARIGSTRFLVSMSGNQIQNAKISDSLTKLSVSVETLDVVQSQNEGRVTLALSKTSNAIISCRNVDQTKGIYAGTLHPRGTNYCSWYITPNGPQSFYLTAMGRSGINCNAQGKTVQAVNCNAGLCGVLHDGRSYGETVQVIDANNILYISGSSRAIYSRY